MMRLSQSYHTRALPADSALWGRDAKEALAGPAGGTDLSEGRHQRIGHRAVVRRVRAGRHAGRDRRPPQLPPELCKFQRDADPEYRASLDGPVGGAGRAVTGALTANRWRLVRRGASPEAAACRAAAGLREAGDGHFGARPPAHLGHQFAPPKPRRPARSSACWRDLLGRHRAADPARGARRPRPAVAGIPSSRRFATA